MPLPGRRIGAVLVRYIAPPAAGDQDIQDPIDDLSVIHPGPSDLCLRRQQRFDECLLLIR